MTKAVKRLVRMTAALGLVVVASGRAEALIAIQFFNATGTFSDLATLSGEIGITSVGTVGPVDLTITGGDLGDNSLLFDNSPAYGDQYQLDSNTYYARLTSDSGGELDLYLYAPELVYQPDGKTLYDGLIGYKGGPLETAAPDSTGYLLPATERTADPPLTKGGLTPAVATPEPSTLVGAGTATLLGLAYAWRRKRKAMA